jgi:hypothetical protein
LEAIKEAVEAVVPELQVNLVILFRQGLAVQEYYTPA